MCDSDLSLIEVLTPLWVTVMLRVGLSLLGGVAPESVQLSPVLAIFHLLHIFD